jgi:thioester reductase-like protein
MATFLTGATGYLGAYVAAELLREGDTLNLLVRAPTPRDAERRLWRALQYHADFADFERCLRERIHIFTGDITAPDLGLEPDVRRRLVETTDSVVHCAASLNRRSERACVDSNVRGTLAALRVAREAGERRAFRRFSLVSTVAVAGERSHETVQEDAAIDWSRRDYDPYGRTKKLAEMLVRDLLPDAAVTVFRPSIVLGDSVRPDTTQFDMVRAFSFLAAVPALPMRATDRLDIVPADWVARSIVHLHRKPEPRHVTYHLSAGAASPRCHDIAAAVAAATGRTPPVFVPALAWPADLLAAATERIGPLAARRGAALLRVFLPYLTYDTVFDNSRVVAEIDDEPAPFVPRCVALLRWARDAGFRYPHVPWPGEDEESAPNPVPRSAGSFTR